MTTQILREQIDLTEATINTERRQIQGVVLIRAGMSLNRRNYSEDVLRKSVGVFEGAKAYVDHGKGARSVRDLSGYYTNVRYDAGKLVADRTFTRNQAGQDAWEIAQEVMHPDAPKNLAGLSINAVGTAKKHATDETALEIESITTAISVDDVDNAAAGGAYRESTSDDLTAAFWEAVTLEEFTQARPDYVERLKKEWKTTRQDDALKAALAESERLQAALKEAQTQIETLQAERDTAFIELDKVSRESTVEQALSRANVPADWKKSLRESLLKSPVGEWAGIIETEEQKAKTAGHRTVVVGAGQQVNEPLKEAPKPKNAPYDMSRVYGPDDLDLILKEA